MSNIHPLASIDPRAELGRDVTIGPFSVVGPDVRVGDGCVLYNNVTLLGPCEIGPRNTFFPYAAVGAAPQDLKHKGEPTRVVIGAGNTIREFVTIHRGTAVDRISGGVTRIGDRNLIMVSVHVAHDVQIGNHVIIANNTQIAGHCAIEDFVNIGGSVSIHHFVTIGRYAFVAGATRVLVDVPPYVKCAGYDPTIRTLNTDGLTRWRIGEESIAALKSAHRLLFARRNEQSVGRTTEALRTIESNGLIRDEHVSYLVGFLRRQLSESVFGRSREIMRTDVPQDREAFYRDGRPA